MTKRLSLAVLVAILGVGATIYFYTKDESEIATQIQPGTASTTATTQKTVPVVSTDSKSMLATEETNQVIYTNEEYGFSLSYPERIGFGPVSPKYIYAGDVFAVSTHNERDTRQLVVTKKEESVFGNTIQQVEKYLTDTQPHSKYQERSIGGFDGLLVDNPIPGIAGETEFYFFSTKGLLMIATDPFLSEEIISTLQKI